MEAKVEDALYLKGCIEERGVVLGGKMVESGVDEGMVRKFFELNSDLFVCVLMLACVEEGGVGGRMDERVDERTKRVGGVSG